MIDYLSLGRSMEMVAILDFFRGGYFFRIFSEIYLSNLLNENSKMVFLSKCGYFLMLGVLQLFFSYTNRPDTN